MQELSLERKNPVKYQIAGSSRGYTVFTVPQDVSTEHWEYNGQQSMKNLGFMPAFVSDKAGGELVYTRFYHIYLPSYIVLLVALALMAWYYFWRGRKGRASSGTLKGQNNDR